MNQLETIIEKVEDLIKNSPTPEVNLPLKAKHLIPMLEEVKIFRLIKERNMLIQPTAIIDESKFTKEELETVKSIQQVTTQEELDLFYKNNKQLLEKAEQNTKPVWHISFTSDKKPEELITYFHEDLNFCVLQAEMLYQESLKQERKSHLKLVK